MNPKAKTTMLNTIAAAVKLAAEIKQLPPETVVNYDDPDTIADQLKSQETIRAKKREMNALYTKMEYYMKYGDADVKDAIRANFRVIEPHYARPFMNSYKMDYIGWGVCPL
jgi:hypothetical protein